MYIYIYIYILWYCGTEWQYNIRDSVAQGWVVDLLRWSLIDLAMTNTTSPAICRKLLPPPQVCEQTIH